MRTVNPADSGPVLPKCGWGRGKGPQTPHFGSLGRSLSLSLCVCLWIWIFGEWPKAADPSARPADPEPVRIRSRQRAPPSLTAAPAPFGRLLTGRHVNTISAIDWAQTAQTSQKPKTRKKNGGKENVYSSCPKSQITTVFLLGFARSSTLAPKLRITPFLMLCSCLPIRDGRRQLGCLV
ncbi:hypothetical protein LZ32DRAFT_444445 [Colletotrichum eremochloae]|nr:hypothetical protein LZ32DRAFT_444445 [Colletotrichum eremochloae]